MKKLWRFLSGGTLLIFLFLLIEVGVVLIIDIGVDTYIINAIFVAAGTDPFIQLQVSLYYTLVILILRVFFYFLAIVLFFRIINKWEDPEFKIPWLVFLFTFPMVTCLFYLIFANHGLPLKEKKVMKTYYTGIHPFTEINEKHNDEIVEELGNACGAFKYIANTAHVGIHKDNRITYYKNGESFFPAFIEGLKKAKEFIFIEFFIITDGQEWSAVQEVLKEKAQQGVDVRIIYDDMGSGGTISTFTPRILRKYGIKAYKFHPFRPILSGVFNNRDHRKIVVIDHQMAFTGGINLADEYANLIERFGYWKDTMVKIEGTGIANLISTFLANYGIASKSGSEKLFKKTLSNKLISLFNEDKIAFKEKRLSINRVKDVLHEKYETNAAIMTSPMFGKSPKETAEYIVSKIHIPEIEKAVISKSGLITFYIQNDFDKFLKHEYSAYKGEGYVMPFGDGPGDIDAALIGEQNYINILNFAQKKVYISTPYLVPTYQLMDALRNAALRGVDVRLIVPGIPDKKLVYLVAKAHFKPLLEAGVKIYKYTPGFNHMKSMLADDELAFVGTINFDFRSLVHHFECGTIIYKSKANEEIRDDFEEMLSQSEQVSQSYKLNIFGRILCGIVKLIMPLL